MSAERDERLYLADMRDAVDRVLRYTMGGRESHPEIPWRQIAGTRDRVIHGYFTVDLEIVWEIVETELPLLRDRLAALFPQG